MIKHNYLINIIIIFIIGILVFFLILNVFNVNDKFLRKKLSVKGKIIELEIVNGTRGIGYNQIITFVYNINSKWYEGHYSNSGDYKIQYIGNDVLLDVYGKAFDKYNIKAFYNNFNKENTKKILYLRSFPNKYTEVKLTNNIAHINKYKKGMLINELVGIYKIDVNKLIVKPVKNIKYLKNEQFEITFNNKPKPIIFKIDTLKDKEVLINLKDTVCVYTRLTL